MPRRPFKIVPDKDVGKTEVLYKGDERHLKKMRKKFDSVKSSEVYPSFDEDYKFTLFFYNTKDPFLSKLFRYSKEHLPRLEGRGRETPLWKYIKWAGITLCVLFVLYVGYSFVNWLTGAQQIIDKNDPNATIKQEVTPGE